tara:strand:- start:811 stop:1464 length:654 start_codon:yes stop_codon:yes gene_type:complete
MKKQDLALITKEDVNTSGQLIFNDFQLNTILNKTPVQYIKKRPAKGGGTWDYVTGGYVRKCLNLMFGWDWSFDILDEKVLFGEVVVKGRLTCNIEKDGKIRTINKVQFGNKDIMYKRQLAPDGTKIALSIGNDMKAAATDCLKKCASELGIAQDIYNKEDFRPVKVTDDAEIKEQLESLFQDKRESLTETEITAIEEIIINEVSAEYKRTINNLKRK